MRRALLWASQNGTLTRHVPRYRFVKRAVRKFMPGETLDDALRAAEGLARRAIPATFTNLGENVTTAEEAGRDVGHYLEVLDRVARAGVDIEISVKLTHLGLDLDVETAFRHFERLAARAEETGNAVWIDMESYGYVDRTIDIYRRARQRHRNVGVCLQAYLRRTERDLDSVLSDGGWVRLVKGAYREPKEFLVGGRGAVDDSYFELSMRAMERSGPDGGRLAVATHDVALIERIDRAAAEAGRGREDFEVQMLYGIRSSDQVRLAGDGYRVRTLIAYGSHWYPWYVRRLAERPANVLFVLRNLLGPAPVAPT